MKPPYAIMGNSLITDNDLEQFTKLFLEDKKFASVEIAAVEEIRMDIPPVKTKALSFTFSEPLSETDIQARYNKILAEMQVTPE